MPDRRYAPRHKFDGVIELIDGKSHKKIVSVASNLSPFGCRVSTTTPFDKGTSVELTIRHGGTRFKATGTVVHSTPHEGMGILFCPTDTAKPPVPQEWMTQASASALRRMLAANENKPTESRHPLFFVCYLLGGATAAISLLVILGLL
jgi:PilZ domain-containing protein